SRFPSRAEDSAPSTAASPRACDSASQASAPGSARSSQADELRRRGNQLLGRPRPEPLDNPQHVPAGRTQRVVRWGPGDGDRLAGGVGGRGTENQLNVQLVVVEVMRHGRGPRENYAVDALMENRGFDLECWGDGCWAVEWDAGRVGGDRRLR